MFGPRSTRQSEQGNKVCQFFFSVDVFFANLVNTICNCHPVVLFQQSLITVRRRDECSGHGNDSCGHLAIHVAEALVAGFGGEVRQNADSQQMKQGICKEWRSSLRICQAIRLAHWHLIALSIGSDGTGEGFPNVIVGRRRDLEVAVYAVSGQFSPDVSYHFPQM